MREPRISRSTRHRVAERAGHRCEYCRSPGEWTPDAFAVEQIIPRALGAGNDVENLALSCQGCNNHKFTAVEAIDPGSGAKVRLFHPRRDLWQDHFTWSADTTQIIGLTSVGRATVEKLRLNRPGLVNLRFALRAVGQ